MSFHRVAWTPYCCLLLLLAPLAGADQIHTVEEKETLYGIARRYNVSLDDLMQDNEISPEDVTRVAVGTKLVIRGGAYGEEAPTRTYVVRSGDTLYGIAGREGCTVADIESLNPGVDPRNLRVGTELRLPLDDDATASATSKAPEPVSPAAVEEEEHGLWPHGGERAVSQKNHVRWILIDGERGDDVVSVASGRVVWSAPYTVYRNVVIIEAAEPKTNEAYRFWYAGNEEVYVRVGDWVSKGTVIASMGVDPFDGAPRVSFAVTKGLKVIDHTMYSWQ